MLGIDKAVEIPMSVRKALPWRSHSVVRETDGITITIQHVMG